MGLEVEVGEEVEEVGAEVLPSQEGKEDGSHHQEEELILGLQEELQEETQEPLFQV